MELEVHRLFGAEKVEVVLVAFHVGRVFEALPDAVVVAAVDGAEGDFDSVEEGAALRVGDPRVLGENGFHGVVWRGVAGWVRC